MRRYKLNKWNPINYILPVLMIPVQIVLCLFTEETIQSYCTMLYRIWSDDFFYHPHKIAKKLWMVIEVKGDI